MKRAFDIAASATGIVVLSPLLLVTALAVKLSDRGPVLYRARRVGRGGELFDVLKFRTMTPDADRNGPAVTVSGDARVTRIGRVLRRTKLDEFPQLINVLRGEMSLVGPRPEDPRYVQFYSDEQRRLLEVRPGITSAASLAYHNEAELLAGPGWEEKYRDVVLPDKLRIDLEYLSQRSIWKDIALILKTVTASIK